MRKCGTETPANTRVRGMRNVHDTTTAPLNLVTMGFGSRGPSGYVTEKAFRASHINGTGDVTDILRTGKARWEFSHLGGEFLKQFEQIFVKVGCYV